MVNLLGSVSKGMKDAVGEQAEYSNFMDQLRHIWVKQQSCKNVEELIKSKDFRRGFSKVLSLHKKYNKRGILGILNKIKDADTLTEKEQEQLLVCISDPEFITDAKAIQNRLMGFTARNASQFLEKYPVSKIIEYLKSYVSDEIMDNFQHVGENKDKKGISIDMETNLSSKEYSIEKMIKIAGEQYLLLQLPGNTIHNPKDTSKRCWKKKGDLIFAHNFQYDFIGGVSEFGDTLNTAISKVRLGSKWAYISVADIIKYNADENSFFDEVSWIKKVENTILYEAKKDGKVGYVRLGKEKQDKKNILFDRVDKARIFADNIFYTAYNTTNKGETKRGHFSLEEQIEPNTQRLRYEIGELKKHEDGTVYYEYTRGDSWLGKIISGYQGKKHKHKFVTNRSLDTKTTVVKQETSQFQTSKTTDPHGTNHEQTKGGDIIEKESQIDLSTGVDLSTGEKDVGEETKKPKPSKTPDNEKPVDEIVEFLLKKFSQ